MPQDLEEPPQEANVSEFQKLKEHYESDARQTTFNLLLLGEAGTGKTHLLKTARKPVHIDSFDPGGTKTVRQEIARGEIFADTRYENENAAKPFAFQEWVNEYNRRTQNDYFENVGTYCIDSLTSWQSALMNYIMNKDGVAGKTPRWSKDYLPHRTKVKNFLSRVLSLPCDVIVTGHLAENKDEVTGRVTYRLMTTGKGTVEVPSLFDEIWVMDPKEQGGDIMFRVLTKASGRYLARSRLASNGKIDTYEVPDLKQIMRKAGIDPSDKPLPQLA